MRAKKTKLTAATLGAFLAFGGAALANTGGNSPSNSNRGKHHKRHHKGGKKSKKNSGGTTTPPPKKRRSLVGPAREPAAATSVGVNPFTISPARIQQFAVSESRLSGVRPVLADGPRGRPAPAARKWDQARRQPRAANTT